MVAIVNIKVCKTQQISNEWKLVAFPQQRRKIAAAQEMRSGSGLFCRSDLCADEPALVLFKPDGGQPAGGKCAGINADAVGADHWRIGDGVPVNNDVPVRGCMVEKFLADPP
jgi:hypothetical protein